jgi:Apea-like HEPN
MQYAEDELRQIIESVGKTVQYCLTRQDLEFEAGEDIDPTEFAPISFLVEGDGRLVTSACLSAYFRRAGSSEDTLSERLRNATVLLMHADELESDPLSLALSFSAIEALVCEKKGGVGEQIREHVPTLLESEPSRRTARKRDALYDLYEIRSRVLHGSELSGSNEASYIVRRIAAGLVRAICVWREHWIDVRQEIPTWKNLMDEVVIASRMKERVIPEVPNLGELLPNSVPDKSAP